MNFMLRFPRCSSQDAINRQAIKLIYRYEQNADRRKYSNPKIRNRYFNAAINARRKAMKRLEGLMS